VLAPNRELADALLDAVDRRHHDRAEEIWPTPRVREFGSWLQEQQVRAQFADSRGQRCLDDIEEREIWRGVVQDSESSEEFLDVGGAARSAQRARRAMYEYGIPAKAVAAYGTDESRALLDWIERFDERCRQLGCISANELLGSMPAPAESIAWLESPIWRPEARRWLQQHGRELAAPSLPAPSACRFVHAASPEAELAAAAEWAKENLQASPNFRAWICVPDLSLRRSEVIDAFDAVLAPQRFSLKALESAAPYAVAGGTPLADYAPVRAALDALAACTGVITFEKFSALLRDPALQASAAEAGAAASLDLQLRERAPSEATLENWLAISDRLTSGGAIPPAALQRLRTFLQIMAAVRGTQAISRWVSIWVAAIEAGPWGQRHRWSSIEYQAGERFRELLASLACADALLGAQSLRGAQGILARAARDTVFQPQTGVPPIWVSSQLIDPWLPYDAIWVACCSEERWPPPPDPIPLLPVKLQQQYGVVPAGAQSQLAFAEDLQQRWRARAGTCVFSYANAGDGTTAAASPLLPLGIEALRPASAPRPHWRALAERGPVLDRLADELAPPFGAADRTHGVRTLKAQSLCAFRGFAESRLDTFDLERPHPGFNFRQRGELLHHALEHIWSELRSSEALLSIPEQDQARLVSDAAARAIVRVCQRRDPGAHWRVREQLRMQGVLAKWLDVERMRAWFEVERLEGDAQVAHLGGLEFSVRIDRVDRLADDARILIDYKTGIARADWRGDRPDNPQLPLYALLLPQRLVAVAYGQVNASECCFVAESERGGVFKPSRPTKMEDKADFAELIATWSGRLETLAANFAAGRAEVAPTETACRSCTLQGLCRIPSALDAEELEPLE
jgi:ATP-dependent helicase/nuclease subunit B